MRDQRGAAKPYARALYELAKERGQVDAVTPELATVVEALGREPEMTEFFVRPWVPAAAKRAVAVEVATRLGLSPLMRDFLGLVARQGRGDHLVAIAGVFRDLADQAAGRVRARVRTAVALSEADRDALRQRLGRVLGGQPDGARPPVREVVIEAVVDDQLLGGFVAEVGSSIVDGSLDGQLARLRERLQRG